MRSRALLIGLLLSLACAPTPGVELRDLDADARLVARLASTDVFRLEFTHSMYGGWVREAYHLAGARLRRTSVTAQRAGAAEYYALYGNLRRNGEEWIVEVPPLDLERLRVRVDATGQPALVSGAERLELLSVVPDGHVVEVRVARP
jgi:hypothetical protein